MSSTISGSTVSPLEDVNPRVASKASLYNPTLGLTGTIFPDNDTIVVDGNAIYIVKNANIDTYTFDLAPAYLADDTDGFGDAAIVSYKNDIFRAYFDTRTKPYTLNIDSTFKLIGNSPSRYEIIRYPNDETKQVVISQSYDSTGTFISKFGSMKAVADNTAVFYALPCYINQTPDDNEDLLMVIYNETGLEIATTTLKAKAGQIINDLSIYQPKIVSLTVTTNQMLADGSSYVFEKQDIADLGIRVFVNYQDGSKNEVVIDYNQCFLYGAEDFVAAYSGQRQTFLIKYILSLTEVSSTTLTQGNGSITASLDVRVVPNQLAAPIKLSVIPVWNTAQNAYALRYYYYTTAGTMVKDVTDFVSITQGTFVGSNYLTEQSFTVSLDLSNVDATTYSTKTTYSQNVAIRLQPTVALQRYTLRDSTSSVLMYGADSTKNRRPILFYDSSVSQYFISSALFVNLAAVLQSFYYNATPPTDSAVSVTSTTPTHFIIRDPFRGVMLTADAISLSTYQAGFTFNTTGSGGTFVGGTVIVEFISRISGHDDVILYGVPVDVYAGTLAK